MNPDIAYNVLSFLENPQQYARTSQSFQQGSVPAQREFMEYFKRTYPLMLTPFVNIERSTGSYTANSMIVILDTLRQLFLLYLNKMALNRHWDLLWMAIHLMDRDLLPSKTLVIDMLHINGNDELAFKVFNIQNWPKRLGVSHYLHESIQNYYKFYSKEPTDADAAQYRLHPQGIGYVPEEVIEYLESHPETWDDVVPRIYPNVLPAIMQRDIVIDNPRQLKLYLSGISMSVAPEIFEIARDYPNENIYTLITRLDPSLTHNKQTLDFILSGSKTYNREMLQFIKDVMIELNIKPNTSMNPIVLAYLRDLWINDDQFLKEVDGYSVERMHRQEFLAYVAVKQAQKILLTDDDLIALLTHTIPSQSRI